MKKEITLVPQRKFLVKFIKDMHKEGVLENAWLFVHRDVYEKLCKPKTKEIELCGGCAALSIGGEEWLFLNGIRIATKKKIIEGKTYYFTEYVAPAADPENIIFLKFTK